MNLTKQIKLIHEITTVGDLEISSLTKIEDADIFHMILLDKNQNYFTCSLHLDFIMMSCKNFDSIIKCRDIIIKYIDGV